jgi:DNA topoisomerase-1
MLNFAGASWIDQPAPIQRLWTEASFVSQLEKNGIGRPSTYESVLTTLLSKHYSEIGKVETQRMRRIWRIGATGSCELEPEEEVQLDVEPRAFRATPLGRQVLAVLRERGAGNSLLSPAFTAQMEAALDGVASQQNNWKRPLQDCMEAMRPCLEGPIVKQALQNTSWKAREPRPMRCLGQLPEKRGWELYAVIGRFGPCLMAKPPQSSKQKAVFYKFPKGCSFDTITHEEALAECKRGKEPNK